MIEFLNLPENSRRQLIEQTSVRTGMSIKAIEKDWWVTLVLKALFSMPQAEHFIFKGGTSLSKAWKIIERFSEDVDIELHQSLLHHRQYYVRIKGIDYTALAFNNLQFVPPSEAMGQFRTDYLTMVEEMIYDEQAPDFDTLIKRLMELQKLFNGIEK